MLIFPRPLQKFSVNLRNLNIFFVIQTIIQHGPYLGSGILIKFYVKNIYSKFTFIITFIITDLPTIKCYNYLMNMLVTGKKSKKTLNWVTKKSIDEARTDSLQSQNPDRFNAK